MPILTLVTVKARFHFTWCHGPDRSSWRNHHSRLRGSSWIQAPTWMSSMKLVLLHCTRQHLTDVGTLRNSYLKLAQHSMFGVGGFKRRRCIVPVKMGSLMFHSF